MTTQDSSRRYDALNPQAVLEALDAVGLHGDGRVLQLNSYENRVFQVFLEDGSAVVAKFYRPGRWSDAQILEEHGFALELAEAEVPVVAPRVLQAADASSPRVVLSGEPATLARTEVAGRVHRFAVAPRCAGREPELEDPEVTSAFQVGGWQRIADWLPWMVMDQRPGHLFYRAVTRKHARVEDLPRPIVDYTERRFPKFLTPPDQWEAKNVSSFDVYKALRKPLPQKP